MKKEVIHNIVVLLVLVVAVGAIFMNSNFNFTGHAVSVLDYNETECLVNNYTWQESNDVNCTDIQNCTLCSETDCVTNYSEILCSETDCQDTCEQNETDCTLCSETDCVTNYSEILCSETDCQDTCEECENITIRECVGDLCGNNIINSGEECDGTDLNGETCESQGFDSGTLACLSDCSDYNTNGCNTCDPDCSGKECGSDGCGGSCGSCDSGYSCKSGECEKKASKEKKESTTSTKTKITKSGVTKTCTSNWSCSAWSECINETQTRTCEDSNNCNSEEGKPETSQSCEMPETCFDGIKNQNEKGIDCGGVCEKRCSVFTIIGSVINGPIESSKEFFEKNKTISLISLGALVLLAGGVFTLKIFLKRSKKKKDKKGKKNEDIAKKIGDTTNI